MLKVEELNANRQSRRNKTKKVYKKILEDVYKKIKLRNEHNSTQLTFHVPLIMFDTPLYDLSEAIRYLSKKLQKGGFKVYIKDNVLLVDWT